MYCHKSDVNAVSLWASSSPVLTFSPKRSPFQPPSGIPAFPASPPLYLGALSKKDEGDLNAGPGALRPRTWPAVPAGAEEWTGGQGRVQPRGGAGQGHGLCPRWEGAAQATQNGAQEKTHTSFASGILRLTFRHSVFTILYLIFPSHGELNPWKGKPWVRVGGQLYLFEKRF